MTVCRTVEFVDFTQHTHIAPLVRRSRLVSPLFLHLTSFCSHRPKRMAALHKYVIVRDIPDIGSKTEGELRSISQASCKALMETGLDTVQWLHSYVAGDKTFCIYLATSEEAIKKHAEIGGFPITAIEEVKCIIDPTTAN